MSSSCKACTTCRVAKELSEFHVDKRARDGVRTRCKDCTGIAQAKYQRTGPGKSVHEKAMRRYRKTEKGRASMRKTRSLPTARIRARAMDAVKYQIRMGRVAPPRMVPCELAGPACSGRHEYHHDSYEVHRRLDVRCLCKSHHDGWHRQNEAIYPEARERKPK